MDECIHDRFAAQVEKSPHAAAVVFGDTHLTYKELNRRSNQLANHLQKLNVGPETLVGLCVERSPEMMVGLLGILKAGGAYVPLDPEYPTERLDFMMKDTNASVLLTQERLIEKLPHQRAHTVVLDRDWPGIAQESPDNPKSLSTAENLAYVIYTSGSTGKPKGVMIRHGGLTNYLNHCLSAYPLLEGRGSILHSTISFDATITALFAPLIAGRAVYVLPPGDDLEALATLLRGVRNFSLVKITPAHLAMLGERIPPEEAEGLTRAFVIGGENLVRSQIAFWQKHAPNTLLFNEYGPTETVVGCIVFEASRWTGQGSVPIGCTIPNTSAYVLDRQHALVNVGFPGELYLGGEGLARGYLGRSDLTAESFILNPFSGDPESRLYKTGDLAEYLPDGNIQFLGRVDEQIKIRGYRIELGEIESALAEHEGVLQAAVIARDQASGSKRLVAYLVPTREISPTPDELTDFLSQKLPSYMVPTRFVVLPSLPLTANGKLDKRALPEDRSQALAPFIAPRDLLETQLARIWEEILRIHPIGINDNFFESGGDSLLVVRTVTRIEEVLNKVIPASAMLQAPTIEQLAQLLRGHQGPYPWSYLIPIHTGGSKPPFYWVHGASSGVLLSRHLGLDQPLYGLELHRGDGKPAQLKEVEAMAARYVHELITVQPQGPYFVGGYSFGAIVAFEMAQQLRQVGQVGLLALLDPPHLNRTESSSANSNDKPGLRSEVSRHLRIVAKLGLQEKARYVLVRARDLMKVRIKNSISALRSRSRGLAIQWYFLLKRPLPQWLRTRYILQVYEHARRNYVPKTYLGKAIYFRSEERTGDLQDWRALCTGGLEVYDLPGDHYEIIIKRKHAALWVDKLKTCLQRAQTAAASSMKSSKSSAKISEEDKIRPASA